MQFLLIIVGHYNSTNLKKDATEGFHHIIKALGCFKGMVCELSITGFPWISGLYL